MKKDTVRVVEQARLVFKSKNGETHFIALSLSPVPSATPTHPVSWSKGLSIKQLEKEWKMTARVLTKTKLQAKIEQIKTKEDFLNTSCVVCCWYCYNFYKTGKWTEEQYNRAMKSWWRHNHLRNQPEDRLLADIKEIFG